jgi:WD40 repeat protein
MRETPTAGLPSAGNTGTAESLLLNRQLNIPADVFTYSSNGKLIATATGATVRLLDPISGEVVKEIAIPPSDGLSYTSSIAFSHDGARLALGRADMSVQVWDWAQAAQLFSAVLSDVVADIEYSHSGEYLIALSGGERGGIVEVLAPETGKQLQVLAASANDVALAPNQDLIATAESSTNNNDYAVRLWRLKDLENTASLFVASSNVAPAIATSVSFSSDGRFLAATIDGHLRIWDFQANHELEWTQQSETSKMLDYDASYWLQVAFSTKGHIGILDQTGHTALLAAETGALLGEADVAQATRLAFAPNGESLLVGGLDADLTLFTVGESR